MKTERQILVFRVAAALAVAILAAPAILRVWADHDFVADRLFLLPLILVGPIWVGFMTIALRQAGFKRLSWLALTIASAALIVPPALYFFSLHHSIPQEWSGVSIAAFSAAWLLLIIAALIRGKRGLWLLTGLVPTLFWPVIFYLFTYTTVAFYETCSHMQFERFATADRIKVTDGMDRPVTLDITAPEKIKEIVQFAIPYEKRKWIAPASGPQGGKFRANFYRGEKFLGDFGYNDRFFTAQGCGYFYAHRIPRATIRDYARLIGVRRRALMTGLSDIKDSTNQVTIELFQLSTDDVNAYVLRLIRERNAEQITREAGLPVLFIHAPQPNVPKIESDGMCYFIRAAFDPTIDRLTSSYFRDIKSGREFCFYVITPEGKRIGYREPPINIGHALDMHVFDRGALLADIARRELVNRRTDYATRILEGYGFTKVVETSPSRNRLKYAWSESGYTGSRYNMNITIILILRDGFVDGIDVEPVLSEVYRIGDARAQLPDHLVCESCDEVKQLPKRKISSFFW